MLPDGGSRPLTPEEEAAIAASATYGVPAPTAEPLVPAGTAAPPTTTIDYPTAGPVGNTAQPYDYGTQVPSSTPAPAPQPQGGMLVGEAAASPRGGPMVGAEAANTFTANPLSTPRSGAPVYNGPLTNHPPLGVSSPSSGAGYSPPTNSPSATSYPVQEYQYQSDRNQGALASPYGGNSAPGMQGGISNQQGLLATYYDEAANHARGMKLAPPKQRKITIEEHKDSARRGALRGMVPAGTPPPPMSTGSPVFDPASPTYDDQAARARKFGSFPPVGAGYGVSSPPEIQTAGTPPGTYRGAAEFYTPPPVDPLSGVKNAIGPFAGALFGANEAAAEPSSLPAAPYRGAAEFSAPMPHLRDTSDILTLPDTRMRDQFRALSTPYTPPALPQPTFNQQLEQATNPISGQNEFDVFHGSPVESSMMDRYRDSLAMRGNDPVDYPQFMGQMRQIGKAPEPNVVDNIISSTPGAWDSLSKRFLTQPQSPAAIAPVAPTSRTSADQLRQFGRDDAGVSLYGIPQEPEGKNTSYTPPPGRDAPPLPSFTEPRTSETSDTSVSSRMGYGAAAARESGIVDVNGNFTPEGWNQLTALPGVIDPTTGAWLDGAVTAGIIDPAGVGKAGPSWLRSPGSPPVGAPPAAEGPFDPNATAPVDVAEVLAVEGGNIPSGGYSNRSSGGGGGYSRRSYGGGGGYSSGGGGRGGFDFGGSFGSDEADDSGWEDLLRDFDNDGDMDEKDEAKARKKAAMRKKTRRGTRGGKSRVPSPGLGGVPSFPESEIRTSTLAAIDKSKKKGKN